jgi:hypothetical protein
LAGYLSPFFILFSDAITLKTFMCYDDMIFRVFIGPKEEKLKFLSKSPENILH